MKNRFCALAVAMLLSACATGPRSQVSVADYREAIDLTGRLSVNYEKDGKLETLSGKFTWVQTAGAVDVSLADPLGRTVAKITVTPSAATLTQTDGVARSAPDIDTLTAQTLGWSLPVSGLREWLQGYATGADGKRFAASPANNSVVTRDGWKLTFVSWQAQGPGQSAAKPVPKRIDAERSATATADALALRIVVDTLG